MKLHVNESLFDNINEWSYKRFSRFLGKTELNDEEFENKLKIIWELIVLQNEDDIEKIAKLSNCSFQECVLKIQYLKNKRKIGDYYIDTNEKVIRRCLPEDQKLLNKYAYYIYNLHLQPREIAVRLPNATLNNLDMLEDQVIEELAYLDSKYIINGMNIDKVDKKIIYYTIDKHKKEKDFITVSCNSCGAINDVPRHGKARCDYCNTIIEDPTKNS